MELWNYMAGGAALGFVASCWSRIKGAVWRAASFLVQRVEIHSEPAHEALVAHLFRRCRRSRLYERMYGAMYEHRRDGRYGLVPYEQFGMRSVIFWAGRYPVLFCNAVEERARSTAQRPQNGDDEATKVFSTLTFLRGTLDVEAMLADACRAADELLRSASSEQERVRNRFVIHYIPAREDQRQNQHQYNNGLAWYQQGFYRLIAHNPEELGKAAMHRGRALDNLIFPERVKRLIDEIELWRSHRAWYVDKGIPWKRGWLLYGPPGTGKTALARAVAEDLNLPIYVYNLAEMGNFELLKAWRDMQVNVPCVALFEDIDNVFHGRENVARRSGGLASMLYATRKEDKKANNERERDPFAQLTFDCLLNCLDGVERSDGVFTIITTNDIAKVDPALGQPRKLPDGTMEFISTRPGRIDKAVELSYMEPDDKKRMAQRILDEYEPEYLQMLDFIERFPELEETPAQFQERCGQVALRCFWRDNEKGCHAHGFAWACSDSMPTQGGGHGTRQTQTAGTSPAARQETRV